MTGIKPTAISMTRAPCTHFGVCGGCTFQDMDADAYRALKHNQVMDALSRAKIIPASVDGPFISPPGSRRRATFAAVKRDGEIVLGFNERRSESIVALSMCPVSTPRIVDLLPALRVLLSNILSDGGKLDVSVTHVGHAVDLLLTGHLPLDRRGGLAPGVISFLAAFAEHSDIARISWRPKIRTDIEPVISRAPFTVRFGGVDVTPPPGGFLQATAEGEAALVAAVLAGTKGAKNVADLYAGCGTFALNLLAAGHKVMAVEGYDAALKSLAAAGRNDLRILLRNLSTEPLSETELKNFDAVVLDPPREGAAPQAKRLVKSAVPRVVSVSCSLNSFVRDAGILSTGGYGLGQLTLIDQFLWSPHVEIVGIFAR